MPRFSGSRGFPAVIIAALLLLSFNSQLLASAAPSRNGGSELNADSLLAKRAVRPKFRATIPGALHQCENTNLFFFNSGNVRPLTVLLIPAVKLPSDLKRPDARTTLKTAQGYGPVQTIGNINTLDTQQYDFGLKLKQGQQFETFAFFPNGTGYNMNLGRTIMYPLPGAPACITPTCDPGQYLDSSSARCLPCPDKFASRCDASGASTRCTYGNVVNGKCTAKICTGATYLNLDGKSCANCNSNVTSCTATKAITCRFGVPSGANCVARSCTGKPSYLSNDGASCISCGVNATACDSGGANKCSYGVVTAGNDSDVCAPVPCVNTPLPVRLVKRGALPTPNYLSQNGTMCLPCPQSNASACDFRGATACSYGNAKLGVCITANCTGTPKPSTLSIDGKKCNACSRNATACDLSGATACSYGVVTFNATSNTNICAPVGPCLSGPTRRRCARNDKRCPGGAEYLSQDGTMCLPCADPYASSCDFRGATNCYYGLVSPDRTCETVNCTATQPPSYMQYDGKSCISCGTNATSCNSFGALTCSYGIPTPDFVLSQLSCQPITCSPDPNPLFFPPLYLDGTGTTCLDCPNFSASCDYTGALTCVFGPPSSGMCPPPVKRLARRLSSAGGALLTG